MSLRSCPSIAAATTTLSYDYEGRATSISGPGVSQTNVYNGLRARVDSTTNSVGRTFLRDGGTVTSPVLLDGGATYTPGVSERRGSATTYLHSGLKNADAQSTTSPTVGASRVYDAFGNVPSSSGTWNGPFGCGGGFGYQEDATGLKLLGRRLFDSSTGRFITRDPVKDGRNWYSYCMNNPIAMFDITGEQAHWVQLGGGGIIPFFSGSGSIGIGFDSQTHHVGFQIELGAGMGMGMSSGGGPAYNYDHTGSINGNGKNGGGILSTNNAAGMGILTSQVEFTLDDSGHLTGMEGGWGPLGNEHGFGPAGVYYEKRVAWVFDLTQAWIEFRDGVNDFLNEHVFSKWPRCPQDWPRAH